VTQVHYIPVPAQPYYQRLGFGIGNYPNANSFYHEALSIPLFFGLTDDAQQFVINSLRLQ